MNPSDLHETAENDDPAMLRSDDPAIVHRTGAELLRTLAALETDAFSQHVAMLRRRGSGTEP